MRARPAFGFACFLLAASLLLAACGSDEAKNDDTKADEKSAEHKAEKKVPTPAPICPQVAIVRGLDRVRNAENDSRDPAELIAGAKLLGVEGDCAYQEDQGGIDVVFNLTMIAKRGPKLNGMHASFPLFVAVVDPAGHVLNKNQFTAEIGFSSDDAYRNHSEPLHVFIPLLKDQHPTGPYYRVLSGFQLSAAQADDAQKAN